MLPTCRVFPGTDTTVLSTYESIYERYLDPFFSEPKIHQPPSATPIAIAAPKPVMGLKIKTHTTVDPIANAPLPTVLFKGKSYPWNEPSIEFYKSLGAEAMDEWTVYRVSGDALKKLAADT